MLRRSVFNLVLLLSSFALPFGESRAATFDETTVPAIARALAAHPYVAPSRELPKALRSIGYDQYRDIRYKPSRALWRGHGSYFQAQFFHRGYLYPDRVDVVLVDGGEAKPLVYSSDGFKFGPLPAPRGDIGFAGFRLHAPINAAGVFDEVCAFLGASYFRAIAKGQGYGLSARGLAIGSGEPAPEEFPVFRKFWIEQPHGVARDVVVHALMDSPSATAAFRFSIRTGDETVFDTRMRLFPRVTLDRAGIAPLTSMFHYSAGDGQHVDDFRPAAHDSDGLAMFSGRGEQIWRPLRNPAHVQFSLFQDHDPKAFGLMQRTRDFDDFVDIEAAYQRRPSAWVEPVGDWGAGAVVLLEIPTAHEYQDNIVAFWRPAQPLLAGHEYRFDYRLHWSWPQAWNDRLATVSGTRIGAGTKAPARRVVIDLVGAVDADPKQVKARVEASRGEVLHPLAIHNPETGGWRVSFEYLPEPGAVGELRAVAMVGRRALSETWLYRWSP